jgi:hypothetical protein
LDQRSGFGRQQLELVGVLQQYVDGVADQVHGGLEAGEQQQDPVGDQALFVQGDAGGPVLLVGRGDHPAEQVFARLLPQLAQVFQQPGVEPVAGDLCRWPRRGTAAACRSAPRGSRRSPAPQRFGVLPDDVHRSAAGTGGKLVQQLAGDFLDVRPQRGGAGPHAGPRQGQPGQPIPCRAAEANTTRARPCRSTQRTTDFAPGVGSVRLLRRAAKTTPEPAATASATRTDRTPDMGAP